MRVWQLFCLQVARQAGTGTMGRPGWQGGQARQRGGQRGGVRVAAVVGSGDEVSCETSVLGD